MSEFTLRLTRRCAAPPDVVYPLLVDPSAHLDAGGRRQGPLFRLTRLSTSSGTLVTGSRFDSTGRVFLVYPTVDVSTVTVAEPERTLEFRTENRYARRCRGTYLNRYDLAPDGDGTLVTYTFQRLSMTNPPLHMRRPMRGLIQRFGAPGLFGRGLDNLVDAAERLATGVEKRAA
jgi:hypothetical protein